MYGFIFGANTSRMLFDYSFHSDLSLATRKLLVSCSSHACKNSAILCEHETNSWANMRIQITTPYRIHTCVRSSCPPSTRAQTFSYCYLFGTFCVYFRLEFFFSVHSFNWFVLLFVGRTRKSPTVSQTHAFRAYYTYLSKLIFYFAAFLAISFCFLHSSFFVSEPNRK